MGCCLRPPRGLGLLQCCHSTTFGHVLYPLVAVHSRHPLLVIPTHHTFWSFPTTFRFLAKSTRQLVSRVPGPGGPTHGRWLRRSAVLLVVEHHYSKVDPHCAHYHPLLVVLQLPKRKRRLRPGESRGGSYLYIGLVTSDSSVQDSVHQQFLGEEARNLHYCTVDVPSSLRENPSTSRSSPKRLAEQGRLFRFFPPDSRSFYPHRWHSHQGM